MLDISGRTICNIICKLTAGATDLKTMSLHRDLRGTGRNVLLPLDYKAALSIRLFHSKAAF